MKEFIIWFKDLEYEDAQLVGETVSRYGEFIRSGIPLPNGFVILPKAFDIFLNENGIRRTINNLLFSINFEDRSSIDYTSTKIKNLILSGTFSDVFIKEVFSGYKILGGFFTDAAIRVTTIPLINYSAKNTNGIKKSTTQTLKGEANLLIALKNAWASLFSSNSLIYLQQYNQLRKQINMAISIQKVIFGEMSGKLYTSNPKTHDKSRMVITALYGWYPSKRTDIPPTDLYEIVKSTGTIDNKHIAIQNEKINYHGIEEITKPVTKRSRNLQKISDSQIHFIGKLGKIIETMQYFPQEVTWTIKKNKLYFLKIQPIIDQNPIKSNNPIHQSFTLSGLAISPGIHSGPVRIIQSLTDLETIRFGDIVVTNIDLTVPLALKKAGAVISENNVDILHLRLQANECGIPAISRVNNATTILQEETIITVNGSTGNITKGALHQVHQEITMPQKTATKLYVNLSKPDRANQIAKQDVDGIGLLSCDELIQSFGTHPIKLLHENKTKEYITKLTSALTIICEAFAPRPVIFQTSNLTSSEYRALHGGSQYEASEPNPFLGLRGVSRYLLEPDLFALELAAIQQVRNKERFRNLWIMLPHITHSNNLETIKKLLTASGLHRSSSFKVWMQIDIPANIIMLEKYLVLGIDGVSINADALSMALLGVDKDNAQINHEFNSSDESLLWAYNRVIALCHKHNITTLITSQKPFPEVILENVIRWGVSCISVQPEQLSDTRKAIAECEKKVFLSK